MGPKFLKTNFSIKNPSFSSNTNLTSSFSNNSSSFESEYNNLNKNFDSNFNNENNSFDSNYNDSDNNFNSNFGTSGSDKIEEHNKLKNRDLPDQHPIKSITGLEQKLEELKNNSLTGNYAGADYPGGPALLAEKLLHTLTIGEYNFNGTEDILIPTYNGDFNNDDLVELLTLEIERMQNNMQMITQNNMQLLEENTTFQMTRVTDSNNMTLI